MAQKLIMERQNYVTSERRDRPTVTVRQRLKIDAQQKNTTTAAGYNVLS